MQGKVVKTFSLDTSHQPLTIYTGLSSGCYMGELIIDEKTAFQKKIIILGNDAAP